MKLSDSIKMSVDDLKNRKLRTFLTCLSIGIGTILIIMLGGLGKGLEKWGQEKINNMDGIKIVSVVPMDIKKKIASQNEKNKKDKKELFKKIEQKDIETIKDIKGVDTLRSELETNITGTKIGNVEGKKSSVLGVDTNNTIIFDSEKDKVQKDNKNENKNKKVIVEGKMLEKGEQNAVLIGERYLNKMGISDYKTVVGKEIELKVQIPDEKPFSVKGKIVGVVNKLYNASNQIIVPLEMASKVQGFNVGENDYLNKYGISRLAVEVKTIGDAKNVQTKIERLGYVAISQSKDLDDMQKQLEILNGLLMAGGIIVLLVSSLGVVNTMSMSILEKTKSIGIMKAVGASKRDIKKIFVMQSATIGFLGGILGIVVSLIASNGLNILMKDMLKKGNMDQLIILPVNLILVALGLAVLISIIAGIIPSGRAAKLDPVETLSYE